MTVIARKAHGAVRVDREQSINHRPNILLVCTIVLMGIGLVMMTSASTEIANSTYGDPLYFFKRQLFFMCLGVFCMLATAHVDMALWYRASAVLLILAIVLLVLVLIPGVGTVVNGSARWIDLKVYRLQPSEMCKLFMVLYISAYLHRRRDELHASWAGFIKPMVILAACIVLLHFEPDHGAMVILMTTVFTMLFLAGARLHRFMLIVMVCFAAVVGLAVMKPYVITRLTSFLNPWAEQYVYGEGYQLTQALIAFGRGEWLGMGLGNSLQKLYFLPEAHTDFVLSIVAEELGLAGALLVLVVFSVLIAKGLQLGRTAERAGLQFHGCVAYGISMVFATQVFINFGVNTGLLPTKGLTLPFLSYGGNSLLICSVMMGVLLRIEYELNNPVPEKEDVA